MKVAQIHGDHAPELIALFAAAFAASDGADEGAMIGDLVGALLREARQDLYVFAAQGDGGLIGAAIFSRLRYRDDPRSVFILSPMAVATDAQGNGVGQAILRHALKSLREDGVDVAITYGDPAYYGQVGFRPLTEADAAAPLPLSMPIGWIGQPLDGADLSPLKGSCRCVDALNIPAIW